MSSGTARTRGNQFCACRARRPGPPLMGTWCGRRAGAVCAGGTRPPHDRADRRDRRALRTGPPGARFCLLVHGCTLCAPTGTLRFRRWYITKWIPPVRPPIQRYSFPASRRWAGPARPYPPSGAPVPREVRGHPRPPPAGPSRRRAYPGCPPG